MLGAAALSSRCSSPEPYYAAVIFRTFRIPGRSGRPEFPACRLPAATATRRNTVPSAAAVIRPRSGFLPARTLTVPLRTLKRTRPGEKRISITPFSLRAPRRHCDNPDPSSCRLRSHTIPPILSVSLKNLKPLVHINPEYFLNLLKIILLMQIIKDRCQFLLAVLPNKHGHRLHRIRIISE